MAVICLKRRRWLRLGPPNFCGEHCGFHGANDTCEALGEQVDGGDSATRRRPANDRPIAGTRLIRDWHGVEHCITVRDDDFEYQGRPYKSLSAVARAITGTQWNGLIFFGLKNHRSRQ